MNQPTACHRVLIIDPSETSGELIALILARHRNDKTQRVLNTAAGWPILQGEPQDAVFIYLRGEALNLEATGFCRRLRASPGLGHVPVIVFGALAPKDIYGHLQEAGATGYLYEPFPPSSVLEARDAALRGETYYP